MSLYDMGRLVALGLAHAPAPTRQGMHDGLERVKQVPSALGEPGTVMGFGKLEALRARGRLPRAAPVARRQVRESHQLT